MLTIRPDTSTFLGHRAFHLATSARAERVVALSPDGRGSLVDRGRVSAFAVPEKPNQLALDPPGQLLAVASDRGLVLLDVSTATVVAREAGAFQGCHFSSEGSHLWVTRAPDEQHAVLEVRHARTLRIITQQSIRDPFGGSFLLFPNPAPAAVSVWSAAGQDGQCLFWAALDRGVLSVDRFATVNAISPPDFAPDGTSFVAVVDAAEVRHYSYPQGRLLATIPSPDEDHQDPIGDIVFFVGPERALVDSNEGRMHMLDLRRAVITEEVVVAGHEPRPVPELYPTLATETGLCSDLTFAVSVGGDHFLSIHRRLPAKTDEWQDEVVSWHIGSTDGGSSAA